MGDNDYLSAPGDFRMNLADVIEEPDEEVESEMDPIEEKIRALAEKVNINQRLKSLLAAIRTLESKEKTDAEENILKVSNYCKAVVFNGESFGDMAKLAFRFTKEKGFDLQKTAKLYGVVQDYLKNKGFNVKEEITKISSLKIDQNSDIYKPIEGYHMSLMKIAGFSEMRKNLETLTEKLSTSIIHHG